MSFVNVAVVFVDDDDDDGELPICKLVGNSAAENNAAAADLWRTRTAMRMRMMQKTRT